MNIHKTILIFRIRLSG